MAGIETTTTAQSPAGLIKNRTFTCLWLAHVVSVVGDGFHSVALGLWVLQTTGSSTAMGAVMTVRIVTTLLLGAVSGTVADRTDRRHLMMAMDLIRIALVGALALVVGAPETSLGLVLLLTGLTSVAGQFFAPAFQASVVNIVSKEDLPRASTMVQIGHMLGSVAGPMLGGMVAGFAGGRTALVIDALTFGLSALLLLAGGAFPSPRRNREAAGSFWHDMKEGVGFIVQQPVIHSIAIVAPLIIFFSDAFAGVLVPVLAVKTWNASSMQYGLLEAALPLGFALGAGVLMALITRITRRGMLMMGAIFAASVLFTVVPFMPSVGAALPLWVLAGVFLAAPNVLVQVLIQTEAPADVQGRIFGVMSSLFSLSAPVAFMLAGRLADLFSPVAVSSAFGILMGLSTLVAITASPALREYR